MPHEIYERVGALLTLPKYKRLALMRLIDEFGIVVVLRSITAHYTAGPYGDEASQEIVEVLERTTAELLRRGF